MPDGGVVSGPILGEMIGADLIGSELLGEYALGGLMEGAGGGFGGFLGGEAGLGFGGYEGAGGTIGDFATESSWGVNPRVDTPVDTSNWYTEDAPVDSSSWYTEDPMQKMRQLSMPTPSADFTQGGQTWTQSAGGPATSTGMTPYGQFSQMVNSPEARLANNLYSGYRGMNMADQMGQLGANIGTRADPWGANGGRSMAASQLQGTLNGSLDYTKNPMYAARLQAAQRQMASQGYNGSGNAAVAAANAGGAGYNDYINQMSGLAGVGNGTQTGAIQMSGLNNQAEITSRSLATGAYGATRYGMSDPEWFKQTPA